MLVLEETLGGRNIRDYALRMMNIHSSQSRCQSVWIILLDGLTDRPTDSPALLTLDKIFPKVPQKYLQIVQTGQINLELSTPK